MNSRKEILDKVKNDNSTIYGQPIFDVFLQTVNLQLDDYLTLNDQQKKLVKNIDTIVEQAAIKAHHTQDIIIIKDIVKLELNDQNIKDLLRYTSGDMRKEVVKLLINERQPTAQNVVDMVLYLSINDAETMANLIQTENVDKLSARDIRLLIRKAHGNYTTPDDERQENIIKLLVNYKTELTSENINSIMFNTSINPEAAKIIIEKKKNLEAPDVFSILYHTFYKTNIDKQRDKVAEMLGDQINKLPLEGEFGIYNLFPKTGYHPSYVTKMAETIIKYKKLSEEEKAHYMNHAAYQAFKRPQREYDDD